MNSVLDVISWNQPAELDGRHHVVAGYRLVE